MLVIVTMRRLDRALQQLWKNVKDAILGVQEIVHPSEKEIVNAISIASIDDVEAPQEGAFYMIEPSDGVDGFLFLYQNGAFNEVIPEEGIIYIVNSPDKSHIYIYDYPLWEDVTGQSVDNTLYITNTTTDLESYTDKGMYSVCLSLPLRNTEWYTFTISVNRGRHMVGRPATNTYIQTLINNDCWKRRTKIGDDSWSDWTEYRYAYTEDLNSKQPLGDYAQAQHTHVFADITDVSILPDNDAQIIIPIDDDILTSIVNQTYSPEDTAMFSGHSEYLPLSDEEVTRLVDLTIETYRQAINLKN